MGARSDRATAEVVEAFGTWFNSIGAARAAGQMFGYLLVCDPAEQAASEIAEATGMSRASVSASARLLMSMDALEQRHKVGDRKTYYRLKQDWWITTATSKVGGFEQLAGFARRTAAAGALPRTDGLDELIEFSEFWAEEMPRLAERWYQRHDTKEEEA